MASRKRIAPSPPPELPLPAKVIRIDPKNLGGVHADDVCWCDDGVHYAVKDTKHGRYIPHSEWFCTLLAQHLNIPSIPCRVLEMPPNATGEKVCVFGSRWQEDEAPRLPVPWFNQVQRGDVPVASIAVVCSWIYAFDQFVHNVDRHPYNYFVQKSGTSLSIRSMDYSKAWLFWGFPLPALPFDLANPHHRTVTWQRDFTKMWGAWIVQQEIVALLYKIKGTSKDKVRDIIQSHPKEWLSYSKKNAILKWWQSKGFHARIDAISAGISSGTTGYV